ncbi:MAG: YicC family protein [Deltaproteobacteria bacterium]|nr:YicC family protein [Deltaproteobacteria bacterium]
MKSMTGYGRAEGEIGGCAVTVEFRSVNHRFKDVRMSLPREWLALEVDVERAIRNRVGRGRVECHVRLGAGSVALGQPVLNEELAKNYHNLYRDLSRILGLDDEPSLSALLRAEGVITWQEAGVDVDAARGPLLALAGKALDGLAAFRDDEGQRLAEELKDLLSEVDRLRAEIEQRLPEEQEALNARTAERIQAMVGQVDLEQERLLQEIAILSERCDVTEEVTRLAGHSERFSTLLAQDGPIGREMDFVLQEMNREINTLSSKVHAPEVSRRSVSIKAELEKMREQAQNVE